MQQNTAPVDAPVVPEPLPAHHSQWPVEALPGKLKIPYALRRVPVEVMAGVVPLAAEPRAGDLAIARVESIGRNTALELTTGRRCTLHQGDVLALVFGNRYATRQFEGLARVIEDRCDLLSMGGLCGVVESKHEGVGDPTRLRLLGAAANGAGRRLRLRDFALPRVPAPVRPRVLVVCGSSMDSGKTHTAMSLVVGLRRAGVAVAAIKLTGTATGSDTWSLLDAGACVALDFIDGGYASTYFARLEELIDLYDLLVSHAAAAGAAWVVIEIADGLIQAETEALLQSPGFVRSVDAWVYATGGALSALGGVTLLKSWGIAPIAVAGRVSRSPLEIREVLKATGLPCPTAAELQEGALNEALGAWKTS